MEEIQDLRKQIDFNNLIFNYKGKSAPKIVVPLGFYKNIMEGYITLENAEE